jgi:AcrR family transcriptional regulator
MNAPSRPRSTRARPAKAPLSEDAVIDAALALLQSDGLEAVTMRRVAAALDTGAASLYVYVSGRDGLLQSMQDRIIATIELEDPDPARWREQLHTLLDRGRQALVAHPGIAATLMTAPPSSRASLVLVENMLGILLAGGVARQDAAWAADIFAMLVSYSAMEADVRRADPAEQAAALYRAFTALPADQFPLVVACAAQLTAGDSDERFRYAVDVVTDGLLARTGRPA